MVQIIRRTEMYAVTDGPTAPAWLCQAADHAGLPVSLVINEVAPGNGTRLHTHDYDEIFVVAEGRSTFTILDTDTDTTTTFELRTGDVARVPAGTTHGFRNASDRPLRQVDIHLTPLMGGIALDGSERRPVAFAFPRGNGAPPPTEG